MYEKSIRITVGTFPDFYFCGMRRRKKPSTDNSQSGTSAVEFKAPENYATVLLVTINPVFRLYLDAQGSVLAVEPVNDDSKSIAKDIRNTTGDLDTVVQDIVAASDKGGFIKENATVDLIITSVKADTVNPDDILNTAKEAANKVFEGSEKTVVVNISIAEDASPETDASNEETTSSSETASTENTTSSAPQTAVSQPQETHTHSFSNATCTEPKKCSCGATEGNALGHSYSNGVCTVCGAKDPNFVSFTSVKTKAGNWKLQFLSGKTLYDISLYLCGPDGKLSAQYGIGDPLESLPEDMQKDLIANHPEYCISFNGKQYYVGRGDGDDIKTVVEDGATVTVTDMGGYKLVLTRTAENSLTVKSADSSFANLTEATIPAGSVFAFKAE